MSAPERVADIIRIHPEYNPGSQSERKGPIRIGDAFEPALGLHVRERGKTQAGSTFKLFRDKPDSTATISFISIQNQNTELIKYKAEISSMYGDDPVMLGRITAEDADMTSNWGSLPGYLNREKPANISDSNWSAWISDVQRLVADNHIARQTELEVHGDKKVSSSSLDEFLEACQTWMGTDWSTNLKGDDQLEQPAGLRFADVVHGISPHTIERRVEFDANDKWYVLTILSDANDLPNKIELSERGYVDKIPNTKRQIDAYETRRWVYTTEGTWFSQQHDFRDDVPLDAAEQFAQNIARTTAALNSKGEIPAATGDQAEEGIRLLNHLVSRTEEEIIEEPIEIEEDYKTGTIYVFLPPDEEAKVIDFNKWRNRRSTNT